MSDPSVNLVSQILVPVKVASLLSIILHLLGFFSSSDLHNFLTSLRASLNMYAQKSAGRHRNGNSMWLAHYFCCRKQNASADLVLYSCLVSKRETQTKPLACLLLLLPLGLYNTCSLFYICCMCKCLCWHFGKGISLKHCRMFVLDLKIATLMTSCICKSLLTCNCWVFGFDYISLTLNILHIYNHGSQHLSN